jgi:hypothetical protein
MSHLDSKGPEGKGSNTGRGLGQCKKEKKTTWPLGVGMGLRRKTMKEEDGKGKRLKSGKIFDNEK